MTGLSELLSRVGDGGVEAVSAKTLRNVNMERLRRPCLQGGRHQRPASGTKSVVACQAVADQAIVAKKRGQGLTSCTT